MEEDNVCLICGGPMDLGEPNPHFFCSLNEDLPLDLDFSSANCKAATLSGQAMFISQESRYSLAP